MKKAIVAAAGLMLVGTMASTAMAEFKFSGDARVRYYYNSNFDQPAITIYDTDDDSASYWTSRTRFKIEADTKGGAYVKTRLYLASHKWGTTSNATASQDISTDYAYIGVPFGPVTVEGGRVVRDVTPFFFFDSRADAIQVKYKNDNTGLVAFYDTVEETDFNDSALFEDDEEDTSIMGALLNQSFEGGWGLSVGVLYGSAGESTDFTTSPITVTDEEDGFGATVHVDGTVGTVALAAELAYQEEEFLSATDDDGVGGYVSATVPIGSVELLGMAGFTIDGYNIDESDFGPFIIIQDYSQISLGTDFSELGESVFVAIAPSFKATEQLTLGAQASYVSVDAYEDDVDDADIWEIGATASYAVTDGASLNGIIGYADVDDLAEDNPFGIGVELKVTF